MKSKHVVALVLGLAGVLASAEGARAQCGLNVGACGIYDIGRLYRVLSQNVPYYAAFPPVYYSAPVPRPYGYSPFAYPPGVMTPEVAEVAPLEISNPYFPSSTETAAGESDKVTELSAPQQPLAIVNPFVVTHLAQNSGR
ncbi:MAG: hypothetical protein KDA57_10640 [Planctomycetales bacterium]|nr:hypothetical protein [Planctomycetales bacterium]